MSRFTYHNPNTRVKARQELDDFIQRELAEIDRRRGPKPALSKSLVAQVKILVSQGRQDLLSQKQEQTANVLRWLKS
jgi:hypothetical protein